MQILVVSWAPKQSRSTSGLLRFFVGMALVSALAALFVDRDGGDGASDVIGSAKINRRRARRFPLALDLQV